MSESPTGISEKETSPRLVELQQLSIIEGQKNPLSVILIPALVSNPPNQDILNQFSSIGADFWFTKINQYGNPNQELYANQLKKIIEDNPAIAANNNLFIVGHSAGSVLAAELGKKLKLPKEQILLIATAFKPYLFRKERMKAIISKASQIARNFFRRKESGPSGKALPHFEYAWQFAKAGGFLYGNEKRSRIPGIQLVRDLRKWRKVSQASQTTEAHLQAGIVFSGKNDFAISPQTGQTDIYVHKAGHNFREFAPAIAQYINFKKWISTRPTPPLKAQ